MLVFQNPKCIGKYENKYSKKSQLTVVVLITCH